MAPVIRWFVLCGPDTGLISLREFNAGACCKWSWLRLDWGQRNMCEHGFTQRWMSPPYPTSGATADCAAALHFIQCQDQHRPPLSGSGALCPCGGVCVLLGSTLTLNRRRCVDETPSYLFEKWLNGDVRFRCVSTAPTKNTNT